MSTLSIILNVVVTAAAILLLLVCTVVWFRAASRRTTFLGDPAIPAVPRSIIEDWFGFVFAALSLPAFFLAGSSIEKARPVLAQSAVVGWFLCGLALGVMGILFLVLSNGARALLLARIVEDRREWDKREGVRIAGTLPDGEQRQRLYIALALHLAGAREANPVISQVVWRNLPSWRSHCGRVAVVRPRPRRGRRLACR